MMSRPGLLVLLSLIYAVVSTKPLDEGSVTETLKNHLKNRFRIEHVNKVEATQNGFLVSAIVAMGKQDSDEEMIYDCKFGLGKTDKSGPGSLLNFTCEFFEVPYAAPKVDYVGGWTSMDIGDNGVQGLLSYVKKALSQNSPSLELLKIKNVESQVVAGINYRLSLEARAKGGNSLKTHTCKVVIFVQEWNHIIKVSSVECIRSQPVSYAGGWQTVDINDPNLLNAAKFAITSLNARCNCMFRKSFTDIISATKQVVNGIRYRIFWKIGESTCRNNDENATKDLTQCPISSSHKVKACSVLVTAQFMQIEPMYSLDDHNC